MILISRYLGNKEHKLRQVNLKNLGLLFKELLAPHINTGMVELLHY
jgi:hypothetical protein